MARRWALARDADGWFVQAGDDALVRGIASRDQALAQLRSEWAAADDGASALDGPAFHCPLIAAEGVETGDGRLIQDGALTWRDLPVPLMGLWETGMGHDGAVVVGRFDTISRVKGGISGDGVLLNTDDGQTATNLIRSKAVRGISVDLDMVDATEEEVGEPDEDGWQDYRLVVTSGRAMAATLCPMPAFQECTIELVETDTPAGVAAASTERCEPCEQEMAARSGLLTWTAQPEGRPRRQAITAAAPPERPDADWFTDPGFTEQTTVPAPGYPGVRGCPLTITADGRVFGHVALWGTCHIGFEGQCVSPPTSPSNYSYFRTGEVLCADGSRVPVGALTVDTGHAPTDSSVGYSQAAAHYDHTGAAAALVACGEDVYGIWVAGTIRPGATDAQIEALRNSSLSGDWRAVRGELELVAALAVNVPGFPVPRYGLAASGDRLPVQVRRRVEQDRTVALVAAGAAPLARLAAEPWQADMARLEARLDEALKLLDLAGPTLLASARTDALTRARTSLEARSDQQPA